jgi:hypothetical protein
MTANKMLATLFFISVRTATIRPHAPLVRDSLPAVSANPTQLGGSECVLRA